MTGKTNRVIRRKSQKATQTNLSEGYSACCDTKKEKNETLEGVSQADVKVEDSDRSPHSSWNEVFKAGQKKWDKIKKLSIKKSCG